ncbi:hypothetical protein CJU90_3249 [Yarrowia sp. C11]|nr:hypothetical protein CKK34_4696 [Yarrowia sp. E02]KAG5369734.1 hypothetical protein CJU90_3249 [Yarrowia sp. C11]
MPTSGDIGRKRRTSDYEEESSVEWSDYLEERRAVEWWREEDEGNISDLRGYQERPLSDIQQYNLVELAGENAKALFRYLGARDTPQDTLFVLPSDYDRSQNEGFDPEANPRELPGFDYSVSDGGGYDSDEMVGEEEEDSWGLSSSGDEIDEEMEDVGREKEGESLEDREEEVNVYFGNRVIYKEEKSLNLVVCCLCGYGVSGGFHERHLKKYHLKKVPQNDLAAYLQKFSHVTDEIPVKIPVAVDSLGPVIDAKHCEKCNRVTLQKSNKCPRRGGNEDRASCLGVLHNVKAQYLGMQPGLSHKYVVVDFESDGFGSVPDILKEAREPNEAEMEGIPHIEGGGDLGNTVVVTTPALVMGVDIPNVRQIIHVTTTGTLMDYSVETERAARQGLIGRCVIFTNGVKGDVEKLDRSLEDYITTKDCLRMNMSLYLDGEGEECKDLKDCVPCEVCSEDGAQWLVGI